MCMQVFLGAIGREHYAVFKFDRTWLKQEIFGVRPWLRLEMGRGCDPSPNYAHATPSVLMRGSVHDFGSEYSEE